MTRRVVDEGPAYTRPHWYAQKIDPDHCLGPTERDDAATGAHLRSLDARLALPAVDPYDLARTVIDRARAEHQVEDREPIPDPPPIDLDALLPIQASYPCSPDRS